VELVHDGLLRAIGHLDLDYFFAQIEEVENPALKLLPVVVCVYSGRTEESGVVSTANYRARELGVKSGIPIYLAKHRLKDAAAAFVPMNQPKYQAYSERIMGSLRSEFEVEQTGIDEAFFDLTRRSQGDYGKAGELASHVKAGILKEEGLTCSIGIAPNKVVAKIASDFKKPDGLTIVRPGEVLSFLSPLSVDKIPGVGPKTSKILQEKGVESVQDLAGYPVDRLEGLLGRKLAIYLHKAASGEDDEPLATETSVSQLSRIITLKADTSNPMEIFAQLSPSIQDLREKLVARNLFFRTVAVIGIRPDLSVHSRSRTLETATNDYNVLSRSTKDLLSTLTSELGEFRRAGIRVSDLADVVDQQSLGEFMS
jgi:DNA polymerase IV (archaeal DinB-like DNA polymerase)